MSNSINSPDLMVNIIMCSEGSTALQNASKVNYNTGWYDIESILNKIFVRDSDTS